MIYTLYRIEDDETTIPVATYPTMQEGVAAGVNIVEHIDMDYAYALHTGATRVVSFREGRTGYRLWAMRTGHISPSLEDKYDHDEDMLMGS